MVTKKTTCSLGWVTPPSPPLFPRFALLTISRRPLRFASRWRCAGTPVGLHPTRQSRRRAPRLPVLRHPVPDEIALIGRACNNAAGIEDAIRWGVSFTFACSFPSRFSSSSILLVGEVDIDGCTVQSLRLCFFIRPPRAAIGDFVGSSGVGGRGGVGGSTDQEEGSRDTIKRAALPTKSDHRQQAAAGYGWVLVLARRARQESISTGARRQGPCFTPCVWKERAPDFWLVSPTDRTCVSGIARRKRDTFRRTQYGWSQCGYLAGMGFPFVTWSILPGCVRTRCAVLTPRISRNSSDKEDWRRVCPPTSAT